MKKILIGSAVLLLLAVAGVGIFVATFDANRYRPMIEQKLSEAVGNPVSIGSLKLGWNGSLVLEAADLAIREEGRTALSVKRAAAALDVWALLSKRVSVPSVEVTAPQIVVLRDAAGKVRVSGVRTAASAAEADQPKSKASGAAPVDFAVRSVRLRDALITFVDASSEPPMKVQVRDLDADVQDLALGSPVRFAAKAAVFSAAQNLEITGQVTAQSNGSADIKETILKTDLARIDWKTLGESVPAARDLPFKKYPTGVLTLRLPSLKVTGGDGAAPPDYTAQAEWTDGAFQLNGFRPEISRVQLAVEATPSALTLRSLTANFADGNIAASGRIQNWSAERRTTIKLEAKKLRIEQLLPLTKSGKTQFEGELGAAFDGGFSGFEWPLIRQSLTGKAVVDLPSGLLLNMNLVREALGKLDSFFPGIVGEVEARLPAAYKPKLTQQSTVLNPFRHVFEIVNGSVSVRDLNVSTDFFSAGLNGELSLEGTFDGRGTIQMDQTFSNAMFEGAPAIRVLANAVSQVELPLKIKYRNNKFSALPDLEVIGRRLVPQGGQLISQVLGAGASAASGSSSSGTAAAAPNAASSGSGTSSTGGWLSQIESIAGAIQEARK